MRANSLTMVLLIEYLILAAFYAKEHRWGNAVYFIGAATISIGILLR